MTLFARAAPAPSPATAVRRAVAAALTPAQLSLGRAGAGAVMLVRPRTLGRLLGVERAALAPTGFAVQMLGARELALGLGTRAALRRGGPAAQGWLLAGLLCDAVDAVVLAGAVGRGRVSNGAGAAFIAIATTSAAGQAAALADG